MIIYTYSFTFLYNIYVTYFQKLLFLRKSEEEVHERCSKPPWIKTINKLALNRTKRQTGERQVLRPPHYRNTLLREQQWRHRNHSGATLPNKHHRSVKCNFIALSLQDQVNHARSFLKEINIQYKCTCERLRVQACVSMPCSKGNPRGQYKVSILWG